MTKSAAGLAATVLIGIVAASGCGVGPGDAQAGEAGLRVTSGFGADVLVGATLEDPTPSDTVVRFLDDEADIETSYGGNFVDSIDGLEGSTVNGGAEDWFFFVNGYYSDIGAGEAKVQAGDQIWWDYRRWEEAYRVPAVVGSWPEPFLHGQEGERPDVVLECVGGAPVTASCDVAADALDGQGIDYEREETGQPTAHPDELRILVGAWGALRADPAAAQIEDGPSTSGVYASIEPCGDSYDFAILGSDAKPRLHLRAGGLVAAVRRRDDQPTWVVTSPEVESLQTAASLLDGDSLRDRYAVVSGPSGEPVSAPAPDDLPVTEDAPACG